MDHSAPFGRERSAGPGPAGRGGKPGKPGFPRRNVSRETIIASALWTISRGAVAHLRIIEWTRAAPAPHHALSRLARRPRHRRRRRGGRQRRLLARRRMELHAAESAGMLLREQDRRHAAILLAPVHVDDEVAARQLREPDIDEIVEA